ncbi:hypothetical protein ACTID9_28340 [Brevibacillus fluminis]|uniref:hypothetical protein n=1 Tax=Brevibacillus fluminis TaxID=511487 RepID=UPI003F8C561D
MARKRTAEFDDMTLRQLRAYSDMHPAEGKRIAQACGETKKYCADNYWRYRKDEVINLFLPGFSKDDHYVNQFLN